MKKKAIMMAALLALNAPVRAEELPADAPVAAAADADPCEDPFKVNVAFDTRIDFDYNMPKGGDNYSGFHGRYLNLLIKGEINDKFSFNFRQRLNKFGDMRNDAFAATDFVYIDYKPTNNWVLSAGKQVMAVGGYEYDRNPINIYYASMFWNNFACYQFGVSGTYVTNDDNHRITFQITNSPYQGLSSSCYAYNLMWQGRMGAFSTIWSTNLIEYRRNHYANFIALGNRYDFGPAYIELDLMNRYSGHQRFLLDDYSVIAKACFTAGKFDIFAKGGYEHFRPEIGERPHVDKGYYGAGIEYYPLHNSRNLRLHLVADVTHNTAAQRITQIAAGIMWRVSVFSKK